jgi:hypothetical protein
VTTLHKTLRKRIYTGEFDHAGTTYHGNYEPLVTREACERVQEILDGRQEKKHRKVTHDFAFSGFVNCGHCGWCLVGEIKKKRYVTTTAPDTAASAWSRTRGKKLARFHRW